MTTAWLAPFLSLLVLSSAPSASARLQVSEQLSHDLAILRRDGLLVGYPDGLGTIPHQDNRYEIAVAVNATAMHLQNIEDELDNELASVGKRPLPPQLIADLQALGNWQMDVNALLSLAEEVKPELAALSVDFASLKTKLGVIRSRMVELNRLVPQFKDVPAGHWAARATLELRQAGILDGYPDGRYPG